MGEWKGHPVAAALGIRLSSREVREVRKVYLLLLPLLGDLEVRSFGGGADFLAQQKMLRCATKGWLVAQGG